MWGREGGLGEPPKPPLDLPLTAQWLCRGADNLVEMIC